MSHGHINSVLCEILQDPIVQACLKRDLSHFMGLTLDGGERNDLISHLLNRYWFTQLSTVHACLEVYGVAVFTKSTRLIKRGEREVKVEIPIFHHPKEIDISASYGKNFDRKYEVKHKYQAGEFQFYVVDSVRYQGLQPSGDIDSGLSPLVPAWERFSFMKRVELESMGRGRAKYLVPHVSKAESMGPMQATAREMNELVLENLDEFGYAKKNVVKVESVDGYQRLPQGYGIAFEPEMGRFDIAPEYARWENVAKTLLQYPQRSGNAQPSQFVIDEDRRRTLCSLSDLTHDLLHVFSEIFSIIHPEEKRALHLAHRGVLDREGVDYLKRSGVIDEQEFSDLMREMHGLARKKKRLKVED